jgi:hypothetical protein
MHIERLTRKLKAVTRRENEIAALTRPLLYALGTGVPLGRRERLSEATLALHASAVRISVFVPDFTSENEILRRCAPQNDISW